MVRSELAMYKEFRKKKGTCSFKPRFLNFGTIRALALDLGESSSKKMRDDV